MWCCDESGTLHIKMVLCQGTTMSDRGILKGGQPQLSFLQFRETMLARAKFRAPFKSASTPKFALHRPSEKKR
jgi:hypothetical protein